MGLFDKVPKEEFDKWTEKDAAEYIYRNYTQRDIEKLPKVQQEIVNNLLEDFDPASIDEKIKEEMPPEISREERFLAKTLAPDNPQAQAAWLQSRHPDFDVRTAAADPKRVIFRKKGATGEYGTLDPQTGLSLGSVAGIEEARKDLTDLFYELYTGTTENLAGAAGTLAALPSGPLAAYGAGAGASSLASTANEAARQALSNYFGLSKGADPAALAGSTASGGLSALIMGPGASAEKLAARAALSGLTEQEAIAAGRGLIGKGINSFRNSVAPKLGTLFSGVPEDSINIAKREMGTIEDIKNSEGGIYKYLTDMAKKNLETARKILNREKSAVKDSLRAAPDYRVSLNAAAKPLLDLVAERKANLEVDKSPRAYQEYEQAKAALEKFFGEVRDNPKFKGFNSLTGTTPISDQIVTGLGSVKGSTPAPSQVATGMKSVKGKYTPVEGMDIYGMPKSPETGPLGELIPNQSMLPKETALPNMSQMPGGAPRETVVPQTAWVPGGAPRETVVPNFSNEKTIVVPPNLPDANALQAWYLARALGKEGDIHRVTGDPTKRSYAAGESAADMELMQAFRNAQTIIRDQLKGSETVPGVPGFKGASDMTHSLEKNRKYLNKLIGDGKNIYRNLKKLGNENNVDEINAVRRIDDVYGTDLAHSGEILNAYSYFAKPALLPISGGNTTSTSRSKAADILGGIMRQYGPAAVVGLNTGDTWEDRATYGALAYGMGSPYMIKKYINMGRGMDKMTPYVKPLLQKAIAGKWNTMPIQMTPNIPNDELILPPPP